MAQYAPRNDTLGAKVVDVQYLTDCIQTDSYVCLEWQPHQIVSSSIMVVYISVIGSILTYQLCCLSKEKSKTINCDIKCISLTYFYCLFIANLCAVIIGIFAYEPTMISGGWELSDNGGWIYDNVAGWEWEADEGWQWNNHGSYQWTSNEGWYYVGEIQYDSGWHFLIILCFVIAYFAGAIATCFSYLYPFRRLYRSFQGSQYALSNISKNIHHFNIFLLFFLSIIGSYFHFNYIQLTSQRINTAIYGFYALGIGYMMYQFDKRLLDLVRMQQPTEMTQSNSASQIVDIHKSEVQLQLIHVVVKYSLLTSIQLIAFALCSIAVVIHQILSKEKEKATSAGMTHIFSMWMWSFSHFCIASCIFLGFSGNNKLYNKLCVFCHHHLDGIIRRISSEQIIKKEELQKQNELQTVASKTKSDEWSKMEITINSEQTQPTQLSAQMGTTSDDDNVSSEL